MNVNWPLLGLILLSVFGVVVFVFVWALLRAAADTDRQMESYLRKNPPDERDPFDRPHGEM